MKKLAIILSSLFLMLSASAAHAVTVTYDFAGMNDIDDDIETFANGFIADSGTILDVNVAFQITPEYAGDISVFLNFNGTSITLISAAEDDVLDAYYDVVLDDESGNSLPLSGTIDGTFAPEEALSAFDSMNANGLWSLSFLDTYEPGEDNTLLGWSLEITYGDDYIAREVSAPASLGLLGLGLAGFGLARRRG
ncbi:PEP-CTERM sorting domain-containing protein [Emcibacter sp.]|uniref:PEP-CTERM sorting domain-containing protein n=1 Tax=Emcibacter sp. TaxID=1979954 RepID=UPI003A91B9C9